MPRINYQELLETLREDVVAMSDLVAERYESALEALEEKDEELAREVIESDDAVNRLYLELEADCIDLFALQQPVAGDLRFVASSFKILTDLERIGDLAVNLAEYAIAAERDRYPEIDVLHIGREAGTMLGEAMAAYEAGDADAAREVAARDDHLDYLCAEATEVVVYDLLGTDYGDDVDAILDDVTRLLLTVRDLERVADHAVNVSARTVYMVEHDDELIY
jgi:phosphate transport system protein